jgi:uncharacterized protein YbdZ (MbtH family)
MLGAIAPAGAEPAAVSPEKAAPTQMGTMAAPAHFWLQNGNSYKCALAQGGADNTPAVQYQCLDYNDQKWSLVDKGGLRYQIRNDNSGKCLLIRGSSNEAAAVQFQCLDYVDQYWTFHWYGGVDNGWYWLKNVNSGKCLIVRGSSDGTQLVQFDCATYVDQAWRLW